MAINTDATFELPQSHKSIKELTERRARENL